MNNNRKPPYTVISDQGEFDKFLKWLPDLTEDEVFHVSLLARAKYLPDGFPKMPKGEFPCTRMLLKKEQLPYRIRQTEAPGGSYQIDGYVVPPDALACYIGLNPRSHKKAQGSLIKSLTDSILQDRKNVDLRRMALSAVTKTMSRKIFAEFDIDAPHSSASHDAIKSIMNFINSDAVSVIKTRGGYHVLVKISEIDPKYKKTWYKRMIALPNVDQVGDAMTPMPGTYQGGYIPSFYALKDF